MVIKKIHLGARVRTGGCLHLEKKENVWNGESEPKKEKRDIQAVEE